MPHLPDPASHLADAIGASPFPWQRRLLGELLAGRVPRALDLPTGLGKTSVMAVWLVARACRATHLPRRLVYVVDRRAVVDQATREAERLRAWATRPEIAAALGDLPISTLRGQHVDNRRWLEDPSAAAIVVGTVDMIGSRLLFEGYGCSRKLRPLQAGLLGADAWFVLDEAHLVPPFERMVEAAVGDPALRSAEAVIPPARVLSLSATGRDHGEATFRLDQDDARHEVVARRLNARKRLTIERLDAGVKLPEQLAARVAALLDGAPDPVRVVVFCNLRDDAEKVKALLDRGPRPDRLRQARTELFVGARRVRERTEAEAALRELGFLAGSPRPAVDAVLVATSAAEVGVDLDADHLVGDVVAWERLVQRLGRVNRRGEGDAQVTLLAAADDPWVDRVEALVNRLPELAGGGRSASPAALRSIGDPRAIAAASTPEPLAPALSRPLLDAWSMTSLREHTGRPEVAPWLRGWVEEPPRCEVVWRTRLTPGVDPSDDALNLLLEAAPPHAAERLEVEAWRVAEWLMARASRLRRSGALAPEVVIGLIAARPGEDVARLTGRDVGEGAPARQALERRLGGRTLVVVSWVGGLRDGLLDKDHDEAPPTADADPHEPDPVVPFRVRERGADEGPPPGWRERLRLPHARAAADEEVTRWWVVDKWGAEAETEDDRSVTRAQGLAEHQAWAADEARSLAARLGLPGDLARALVIAARLHDEGKRAARWQRAFRARPDMAYAKTAGPVNVRLLDGYRHELGSLPHAETDPELATLPADLRELVLHLIAAHHGFARPTIPTSGCDDAPPSVVEARARSVTLRFITLQERWGPWGLAWLETLLRAADQRASRRNDDEGRA